MASQQRRGRGNSHGGYALELNSFAAHQADSALDKPARSPLLQAVQRLFYEAYFASRLLLYVSLCSSYAILLRGKTREIVGRAAKPTRPRAIASLPGEALWYAIVALSQNAVPSRAPQVWLLKK